MNREILFRGRREDGRGWAEGGIVQRSNGQVFIAPVCWASQIVIKAVDPATVGQYTGLKDKNGQKIFEGDVVEYEACDWPKTIRASVSWGDGCWQLWEQGCPTPSELDSSCTKWMTVIGNIHDTPELMNSEGTTRNGG